MPVVYIFFAAVHRSRCHVASTTPKFDMVAAFMTALLKKSKSSAKLFSSSRHSCLTGLSTTKCVMSLIVCLLLMFFIYVVFGIIEYTMWFKLVIIFSYS